MENLNTEKSLLEITCDILAREQTSLPIKKVIKEALGNKGIVDDEKAFIRLYSEIINSSKFVYMGEGNWDLKDREPLSQYDLDGSAFYVPSEEPEEEEEDVLRADGADDFTISAEDAKQLEETVGVSTAGLAEDDTIDDELIDMVEDEEIEEDEFDYSSIYDDVSDNKKDVSEDLEKYDDYIDYEDEFEK